MDGPAIDMTVAHPARRYNYWLGGKDNFAADRESGDEFARRFPGARTGARANRAMLQRAVRFLAAEAGIRQFLDIGTGLPTADNTHEVAQRVNPQARIVYVDNDPLVLAHARALLTSTEQGQTRYLDADLHEPEAVMAAAREVGILDFDEPIALILMGIVGHIPDWVEARRIVATLVEALPSGSYLVVSDSTNVFDPVALNKAEEIYNAHADPKYYLRTPEQITELFTGFELVEPGVISCPRWRPTSVDLGEVLDVDQFGGVGRKL